MPGEIITTLKNHIDEDGLLQSSRFVFHSETAALFWGQRALSLFNKKTIARDRFIAWDVFKAENLSIHTVDKKPVSRQIRLLFACSLCEENIKTPFFKIVIPAEYAKDSLLFARNISSVLSSLKLFEKKANLSKEYVDDSAHQNDFNDLKILKKKYETFLNTHNLFESSWEKPPFKDRAHQYYIFYPELIEDYAEYEELLNVDNVHKINVQLTDVEDQQELLLYESTRAELRSAILEIRRLHNEQHIPFEDIALSAGDIDLLEPYLRREFKVFNVPYNLRSGKSLADYGAGMFFSLINDCIQNNFSWSSIEALICSSTLPWRCPNKNRALLSFGIKNNCVWGYREYGQKKDIWEEAFRNSKKNERLYAHYKKLKSKILAIGRAKTFSALLKRSNVFFQRFFKEDWSAESSSILGRCLNELAALAAIEKTYPALTVSAPLQIFIFILNDTIHVRESIKTGVNIFAYGVAAAIPCKVHLIINASQNALTKIFHPLAYIRQDKRKMLEIEDIDISRNLIKSYKQSVDIDGRQNMLRISAASSTLSGAAIPHSYFNRLGADKNTGFIQRMTAVDADFYIDERNWWLRKKDFPSMIFPAQKNGFKHWFDFSGIDAGHYTFFTSPVPPQSLAASLLNQKIEISKHGGKEQPQSENKLKISPTSLNNFFYCPVYWLYRNLFKLKKYVIQAKMLDDENKGILYHEILCALFAKINEEDKAFLAANIEKYCVWTEAIARETAKTFKSFRGPLGFPLISGMAAALTRNIVRYLEVEAKQYDNWSIAALEQSYTQERKTSILTGKLDRVSVSAESIPVIVDYKTGGMPHQNECFHKAGAPLQDFQIPVYIKLFEFEKNIPVENAVFAQLIQSKLQHIIRSSGKAAISRNAYQSTLDILEAFIERYEAAIDTLDWTPREVQTLNAARVDFSKRKIPRKKCASCDYCSICRTNVV